MTRFWALHFRNLFLLQQRSWGFVLIYIISVIFPAGVHALDILVLDGARRAPIQNAAISCRVGNEELKSVSTDAAGHAAISLPSTAAAPVQLLVSKAGFSSMRMTWPPAKVPLSFEFILPEAQKIGGTVLDQSGNPIPGARITWEAPQRLAGPFLAAFSGLTDQNGRWSCDWAPKETAYLIVEVSHPDYISPEQDAPIDLLSAGQAVHRLLPVFTVRGRLLDEENKPVPGAEVVLGAEGSIWPSTSTPETHSDTDGRFEFSRIPLRKALLGIKAGQAAPKLLPIEVKRGMPLLEVRLKRGTVLRVRIQDQSGQPLPGVTAVIDEWPSSQSSPSNPARWERPGWEWKTDEQGQFVWSNSPPETATWTFSKGGYMSRVRQGLQAISEEQVVTLLPAFNISGTVVDAATKQTLPQFTLSPRFVMISEFRGAAATNFGNWEQYNQRQFSQGQFKLNFESPLLSGSKAMHAWQFRVDAPGYSAAISRVVRHEESGLRINFEMKPSPAPEIAVPVPEGLKKVTVRAVMQPSRARPGETVTLFIKTRVASGHHIYALDDSGCKNQPTSIDLSEPPLLKPDGPWRGPNPKVNEDGSRVLVGDLIFQRSFQMLPKAAGQKYKVPVKFTFQVCDEAVCWPPETIPLEFELDVL